MLSFVEAWARTDRPVVLFLDDLQWADSATLELCRMLLGASDARMLVIGTYRLKRSGLLVDGPEVLGWDVRERSRPATAWVRSA